MIAKGKSEIRTAILEIRDSFTAMQRQQWDWMIHQKLWGLPAYQKAQQIMTYLSMGSEVDTWPIVRRAWQEGKTVIVPRLTKDRRSMEAVILDSEDQLVPGVWGIKEPKSGVVVVPKDIDLVVVPGLAFNTRGYRLGYGGGFFDRFLPEVGGYKVGICYEAFIQEIPLSSTDYPVDVVLTEEAQYP